MKPVRRPGAYHPPIVAGLLLIAAAASIAVALGLRAFDGASWIGLRIASAQGTMSPETKSWLDSTVSVSNFLRLGLRFLAATVLVFWLGRKWRQSAERYWPESAATASVVGTPRFGRGGLIMIMVGCAAVVGWNFETLRSGYFRYDDFEILSVAHDEGFWRSFWMPHGDHFMPLTRAAAFVGWHFFGATAWPYNVCVLLCMCGVIVAGILLLNELGAGVSAQMVFVALVIFWSPWAEILTGYYVLSSYSAIAALGMVAVWFYLRWLRSHRFVLIGGSAVAALGATLIDVSGWYVPAALVVFVALNGTTNGKLGEGLARHRWLLVTYALAVLLSLGAAIYCYKFLYPGLFLSMATDQERSSFRFVVDWLYVMDAGLLMSLVAPFIYARLPIGIFLGLAVPVTLLTLGFLLSAFRASSPHRRRQLIAVGLVVVGISLMITLGRPSGDAIMVRWAAKHVSPAYVWLCLLLVLGWDALWQRLSARRRPLFVEATCSALLAFALIQAAVGGLGMAVAFPPFGYPSELRDAARRREAVAALERECVAPLRSLVRDGGSVPTLDGVYIQSRYPSLHDYNLSQYLPFFDDAAKGLRLVRTPSMQVWHAPRVTTVPVLRDAVSGEFRAAWAKTESLRKFYLAEIPLKRQLVRTNPEIWNGSDPGAMGGSDESLEIVVQQPAWDPESAPYLLIALECVDQGSPKEVPATLIITGDDAIGEGRGKLTLSSKRGVTNSVDLRQLYAVSLSKEVRNLRIVLEHPRRYVVHAARVVSADVVREPVVPAHD